MRRHIYVLFCNIMNRVQGIIKCEEDWALLFFFCRLCYSIWLRDTYYTFWLGYIPRNTVQSNIVLWGFQWDGASIILRYRGFRNKRSRVDFTVVFLSWEQREKKIQNWNYIAVKTFRRQYTFKISQLTRFFFLRVIRALRVTHNYLSGERFFFFYFNLECKIVLNLYKWHCLAIMGNQNSSTYTISECFWRH